MGTYASRPKTITAVQYNGSNEEEIAALIGEVNVNATAGRLQIRQSEGIWENVQTGQWAAMTGVENNGVCIFSDILFRNLFE